MIPKPALAKSRDTPHDLFGISKSPTKRLLLENDVELRAEALDQEDVSSPERGAGSKQWRSTGSC